MTEELAQQETADETTAKSLEHSNLVAEVRPIKAINSDDQFQRVVAIDAAFKAGIDFFEEHHRPNIDRWHKGHKAALADLARDQKSAKEGLAITTYLLVAYKREQDRLRVEEQRRLEQEAEDEKRRVAQIARDAGEKKLANEILKRPAEPVVAPPALPKTAGLHFAKHKDYEIVNTEALMKLVLAGKVPISEIVIEFNWKFIQKQMTQLFDSCKPDEAADKLGTPTKGARWLYDGAVKVWETDSPVRKG